MAIGAPFGDTIFCEDIREEVGGKLSFMGVYTGAMVVPALPFIIPRLCLRIRYFEPHTLSNAPISIKVLGVGDDSIIYEGGVDLSDIRREAQALESSGLLDHLSSDLKGQVLSEEVLLNFERLVIEETGYIRVRAARDGRVIKLGAMRVTTQVELDSEDEVVADKLNSQS